MASKGRLGHANAKIVLAHCLQYMMIERPSTDDVESGQRHIMMDEFRIMIFTTYLRHSFGMR